MPVYNLSNVVVSRALPDGNYDLEVDAIEQSFIGNDNILKLTVLMSVLEPTSVAGRRARAEFILGKKAWEAKDDTPEEDMDWVTAADPTGSDPRTVERCRGFKQLTEFIQSSDWERAQDAEIDTDVLIEEARGLRVGAFMQQEMDGDRMRPTVKRFYRRGTQNPGFLKADKPAKAKAPKREAKTRTRAMVEETD